MLNCKQYGLNQVKVYSPRLLNQPVWKFSIMQVEISAKIFDFQMHDNDEVSKRSKISERLTKKQQFEINCLSTIGLVDTDCRQLYRVRKVSVFLVDISFVIT